MHLLAPDQPDIEIVMGPGGVNGDDFGVLRKLAGLTDEFYQKYFGKIIYKVSYKHISIAI